jgi:hypothetical protein
MNKARMTLGQLFARITGSTIEESEKPSGEEKKDSADESTGEESGEESEDPEPKKEGGQEEKKPEAAAPANTVSMSLADYNTLCAFAKDSVAAREENVALKAKADKWDTYQAALTGGKPSSDTAGSKNEAADETVDEHEALRKKHGALMEGL